MLIFAGSYGVQTQINPWCIFGNRVGGLRRVWQNLQEQGLISQLQNQLAGQIKLNTFNTVSPMVIKPSISFFEKELVKNQSSIIKSAPPKFNFVRDWSGSYSSGFSDGGFLFGGGGMQS